MEMESTIIKYLDGSLSEEDAKLLLDWVEKSEENRKEFVQLYLYWHSITFLTSQKEKIDIDLELKKFRDSIRPVGKAKTSRPIRKRFLYYATAAASVCLLVMSVIGLQYYKSRSMIDIATFALNTQTSYHAPQVQLILAENDTVAIADNKAGISYNPDNTITVDQHELPVKGKSSGYNQLVVPYGKTSRLTLGDGTQVWINAGTRLIYPPVFKGGKREIYVQGEVFLDVAHDANAPFIVKTLDWDVKVLGTRFNVNAHENDPNSNVVLVEGLVNVTSTHTKEATTLTPRQMYEYDNISQRESLKIVNTKEYTSWIEGKYLFNKESAADVFETLSRYYGVEIRYDEELAAYRCSGKLNLNQTMDEVLDGLSNSIPFSYTVQNNVYIINKCSR